MIFKSYEIQKKISNFIKYNIFLLYGENYGIKKEIQETIHKKINQENSNLETISLYESDIIENAENFYNTAYSGSLFSSTKIITINDCSDKILAQIEDVFEKKPENLFLILFSNILDKKSKLRSFFEKNKDMVCVPCYLDTDRDLEIVTTRVLRENKIFASREVINLLIQKANNDRNNLFNELEKIKSFAINKKSLDVDEVKKLINFSGEYKPDNLINECLSGNISEYKKIIAELYTNTINQILFLRILNSKVQKLLKMKATEKDFNNVDGLINSAKPPIFWKDKPTIKKQLTIWNFHDLQKIIYDIDNTELLCKKNPQIAKVIFFKFFNSICKKASNYS
jgi:DNA polymerase-3 subunit delta